MRSGCPASFPDFPRHGSRGRAISAGDDRWVGGQATVEAVAGFGVLLFAGLLGFQILLVGYSHQLADGAAHAAAIAVSRGEGAHRAARRSLPEWAASRHQVSSSPGAVRVMVQPPAPGQRLARLLEVESTAYLRRAGS